eukprot:751796-Amphidinium_carterae.3
MLIICAHVVTAQAPCRRRFYAHSLCARRNRADSMPLLYAPVMTAQTHRCIYAHVVTAQTHLSVNRD